MRAIIRINTNIDEERIYDVLKGYGWIPSLPQADCERSRNEILQTIHEDDIEIVRSSPLSYVLLHNPTRTWGIINKPHDNLIIFRLKSHSSGHLRTAAESLVNNLQSVSDKDKSIFFEFEKIQVLEPGGNFPAFAGKVLPKERFSLSIQRHKTDWYVGGAAFITTIILFLVTIPPVWAILFPPSNAWAAWALGFLDRLLTTTIVTTIVSLLSVFLNWFELRKQSAIQWELDY